MNMPPKSLESESRVVGGASRGLQLGMAALVALGVAFAVGVGRASRSVPVATPKEELGVLNPSQAHPPVPSGPQPVRTAPWGELTVTPLLLSNADAILGDPEFTQLPRRWFFRDKSREEILELLREAGVNGASLDVVGRDFALTSEPEGGWFSPTPDWTLSLPSQAHARIGRVLGGDWRNRGYFRPFINPRPDFDEWLRTNALSAAGKEIVRSAAYEIDETFRVSDTAELFAALPDDRERRIVARYLGRQRSLQIQLRLSPNSDIESLASYWGVGGRRAQAEALLEAHAQSGESALLDIVQLLPSTVRALINTYPPAGSMKNCCWTAAGFFNPQPAGDHLDFDGLLELVQRDYIEIPRPTRLGDLVVFCEDDDLPVHVVNHIAGDIVFTKNGIGSDVPWSFQRACDLVAGYGGDRPGFRLRAFRSRAIEGKRDS